MATVDSTLALVTLADVKEYLTIASGTTSEDSILGFLINEVSRLINSYTGRYLLQKTWTEYHDGNGSQGLILAQYPIVSVTSVVDDINRAFTGSAISTSLYYLMKDSGIIMPMPTFYGFVHGQANVKVVYIAGYALASVPQNLQLAVKRWVAAQYFRYVNKRHEIQSETVGDKTTTFLNQDIPKDVALLLNEFRRIVESPTFAYND